MDELNIKENLENFWGTYEMFQDRPFAQIVGEHSRQDVIDCGGVLMLATRSGLQGYTEAVLNSPEVHGAPDEWWSKIKDFDCAYFKIHTSQNVDALKEFCVSQPDNYDMVFDLSAGPEAVYESFTKKCRESIRIGMKKGVTVREASDESELTKMYEYTLDISDNGKKFHVPAVELLKKIYHSPYGRLLAAVNEQGDVIGGYFLLLGRNAHIWTGGISRDFVNLTPGNLMIYESMRWAADHGYRYIDFCDQSLSQNEPVAKFKLSFNPMLVPMYVYQVPKSKIKMMIMKLKDLKSLLGKGK